MATPFYGRGPGPGIARMDMQAATAPGRAYGKMFESLGESAGDAIETYSKNKQRSEMLDGQIGAILMNMTPEQQAQLDSNPIGKTLKKFVNQDLSLSGKESLLGSLAIDMQMDAQRKQTEQRDYLFNQQKAQHEAVKRFNQRSMGMIPNPEVEKIDAEIQQEQIGLNRVITNPPTASKTGIPAPSQEHLVAGFTARIKALEESKEALDSQIPMMAADGQTFVDRYGTPTSAEEAGVVREDYLRRQTAQVQKGGFTDDIVGPDGQVYTYRFNNDGSVRALVGKTPAQPGLTRSPKEELVIEEGKLNMKANVDLLNEMDKKSRDLIGTGRTARAALSTLNRLPQDATTGGFSQAINTLKKYLNSAGVEFGPEELQNIATYEQFMQQTGEFLFKSIQQTKGSISNAEMDIFMNINPGSVQSRAGNEAMLRFIIASGDRAAKRLRYKQDLELRGDIPPGPRVRMLDDWLEQEENSLVHLLDPLQQMQNTSNAPTAPLRSGARQVPQGGGVIRTTSGGEIKLIP